MKIEFIKRGAATRLILIFAGWSTDARYYNDCVVDGWDTAVVTDYRDLTAPYVPSQYSTVYIFAYSLGVAAAAVCDIQAAIRIAICGSPYPSSDRYGIPETVYSGTLDGLNERSLTKFHLRMAGDRQTYESIKTKLPQFPDISFLKDELVFIRENIYNINGSHSDIVFHRVYLAEDDRIFPYENLKSFWKEKTETEIVSLKQPHAVDIASIVKECLPDTKAIEEGFARASRSYNENAVIQKEICQRMCDRLETMLRDIQIDVVSLLEIGAGNGLLTQGWSRLLTPGEATYVDLAEMPLFEAAKKERYINADAETWLEACGQRFDIILSASTIQWFADPVRFISTLRRHLNPGGFAILSTFVKGNLYEFDALRPAPIFYKTEKEYTAAAEDIETETWERVLHFKSAKEMLMHIRLTGVSPRRSSRKTGVKNGESPAEAVKLTGLYNRMTYRPMIVIIRN
ncbi:MAG: DUF452 family protein [Muribaculaceae bacterium]|nr:DUF452 family protein [Muribaculaceae bacterium]